MLREKLLGQVLRGTQSSQYFLRECIGEGGQGWLFTANWEHPEGVLVIVKVLRPDILSADALPRFQREAEVLQRLSQRPNPHVVRYFDHAIASVPSPLGGAPLVLPFTVLEYVAGTTLADVLEKSKGHGLPIERTRRILRQIASALDMVHGQRIVHRDLKPSNILLAQEAGGEVAKLTDFGLVKLIDISLHRTTSLAGATLGYAPPEQFEPGNKRVAACTDIFAFAAITYEMLTGVVAFTFSEGENPLAFLSRMLKGQPTELSQTNGALPAELTNKPSAVAKLSLEISRALSTQPEDRHGSIMDFWHAVDPALSEALAPVIVMPPAGNKSGAPFGGTLPIASAADPFASTTPSEPPNAGEQERVRARAVSTPHGLSHPTGATVDGPLWSWRILGGSMRAAGTVLAGVFAPGGGEVHIATVHGLATWKNGGWVGLGTTSDFGGRRVHAMHVLPDGEVLVTGTSGLVGLVSPRGRFTPWFAGGPPSDFFGVIFDEETARTYLVGERMASGGAGPTRRGTIFAFEGAKALGYEDVAESPCLRAVTKLSGGTFLAVGERGALVHIDRHAVFLRYLCDATLHAVRALPEGSNFGRGGIEAGGRTRGEAVTVGGGGHALYLPSVMTDTLEPVSTTKDLLTVALAPDGSAWAAGHGGRIVRRNHGAWARMTPPEMTTYAPIIALHVGDGVSRFVCNDGSMSLGQPCNP